MTPHEYDVLLMQSTSHAVRAEKLLRGEGIECKMIPVPRHVSSDCGVCLRILAQDAEAARRLLEASGMVVEGIHAA